MAKSRSIKSRQKIPPLAKSPDQLKLSATLEAALDEVAEKIFTRLHDEGYIAHCVYMDSCMGGDLLTAIAEEIRQCIRG